jgi:hypothetical protein
MRFAGSIILVLTAIVLLTGCGGGTTKLTDKAPATTQSSAADKTSLPATSPSGVTPLFTTSYTVTTTIKPIIITIQPSTVTITNPPAKTTIPSWVKVHVEAVLNKTSLSAGDNLTIQATYEYIGEEPSIDGIPCIFIWSSDKKTVATWYLGQNGDILTGFSPAIVYPIGKNSPLQLIVSWDLTDYLNKTAVPTGEYQIQLFIAQPSENGISMLPTDQVPTMITIN